MRAKIVNENLNSFTRGLDVKKIMEIGWKRKIYDLTVEKWREMPHGNYLLFEDSEGAGPDSYLAVKWDGEEFIGYGTGGWQYTISRALNKIKPEPIRRELNNVMKLGAFLSEKRKHRVSINWARWLGKDGNKIDESVSFKRGLKPQKTLELGIYRRIPDDEFDPANVPSGYYLTSDGNSEYQLFYWNKERNRYSFSDRYDDSNYVLNRANFIVHRYDASPKDPALDIDWWQLIEDYKGPAEP